MDAAKLLDIIAEDQGVSRPELMDMFALDSVVPGICTNEDCLAVDESVEGDAQDNWCRECRRNTVKSFLILEGVI